jgi:hypothetical protein
VKEEEAVQRLLDMAEMYGKGGRSKKYGVVGGNAASHTILSLQVQRLLPQSLQQKLLFLIVRLLG